MHELALTEGIISIVNSEAKKQGFTRVLEIRLRVGEYSGVIPECLEEFFPIAAKGSAAEHAELAVETVKAVFRCGRCGETGAVDRRNACCAKCGSTDIRMIAGREFYVASLKVE